MYYQIDGTSVRLLGSMHRFPVDRAEIPIWVANGYDWAKRLILECDAAGATFGLSSNRNDLDARLSGELLDWLKRTWTHFGFKYDFSDMLPCIVPVVLGQAGLNMTLGVEAYLRRRAVDDGKSVEFLENESDFLEACSSADIDDIVASIELIATNFDRRQLRVEALHEAWLMQDKVQVWAALSGSPMEKFPSLHEAALLRRNRAWTPKILGLLEMEVPTLVVVGALHLCGPGNLEDCLGRKLTRLS